MTFASIYNTPTPSPAMLCNTGHQFLSAATSHWSVRLDPAFEGGRDVFALGTIVVDSSHLHNPGQSPPAERDYSYADANEVQAIAIARSILKD
ncbi:hypothetical protein E4U17_004114 [Claviceps sp. LM77 group G4]|nr:hypothetical protein E4U17_004114 [Claviceps sp. LM77 group G4]KAG6071086.1 hypothetical protein E4U33_003905 [Claviceps sp. LM78 group G4]